VKYLKQNPPLNDTFIIPDLCQTTSLLLLVLSSELTVLAWVLLESMFSWTLFATRSLLVQWIVLLSASSLCGLRSVLPRLTARQGWFLCFAIILMVSVIAICFGYRFVFGFWPSPPRLLRQMMAVAIIAAMVLRYFQLMQQALDNRQAEMGSRMDALQARIKPHFLFNSLNTIAQLIATKPNDAEVAVENLASLFRANLRENATFCSLQQELTLVKGYLDLERWRLGARLTLDWEESIHDPNWPVPVLCLQPLVENAVVHGVANSSQGGTVIVRVLQTPRITTMSVENAITQGTFSHQGHGVGLANIQHRLLVLYGDQARCRIEQTAVSYKVILTLPKTKQEAKR
jgi:two-component system, LytTR family, sensor histidine kinase AlgZ